MHATAATTADALRENLKVVNAKIFTVRHRTTNGLRSPNAAASYLVALRACHELREIGGNGPLFDELAPTPINDQLVGITAEQRKEREWKGVFARFPFPVAAPFQFLEAAE